MVSRWQDWAGRLHNPPWATTVHRTEHTFMVAAALGLIPSVGAIVVFLSSLSLLTGCAGVPIRTKNGTTHYIIVGLGVVSVKEQAGVSASSAIGGGILAGPGALTVGLGQHQEVQIAPEQAGNAVISVGATPLSLTVTNFDINVRETSAKPTLPQEGKQ